MLTADEFESAKISAKTSQTPLLLQIGSATCERCPAFHDAIAKLKGTHQFTWAYCDAHHQDTDLPEHFAVTQLPAFVTYDATGNSLGNHVVVANASIEQLTQSVTSICTPVFTTDAEF
tara:strand:+ start:7297 stop:7650 length:354 start_codon:yes stop_codon:yes gene_type:complete